LKKTFLLLFFLCNSILFAQNNPDIKRTMHWFFGETPPGAAGLDFTSGIPVPDTISHMLTRTACFSMSDTCGNLLFYGDADTVYNKEHQMMQNGDLETTVELQGAGTLCVPQPGNDSIYYIFYCGASLATYQLPYAIVNINKNNGFGEVISKGNNLFSGLNVQASVDIGAVNSCDGNGMWISGKICSDPWNAVTDSTTNKLYAWLLDSSGLHLPVISTVAKLSIPGDLRYDESGSDATFTFSPDGHFAAKMYMPWSIDWNFCDSTYIEIYRFDNCTGVFSDPISFQFPCPSCMRFSPDGTKLFVPTSMDAVSIPEMFVDTTFIAQYDLTNYNLNDILASRVNVFYDTSATVGIGQMQYGIDGKLYICDYDMKDSVQYKLGKDKLGVINFPDAIGPACDYVPDQIFLDGRWHAVCLPNFVSSYFYNFKYDNCSTTVQELSGHKIKFEIYPNPATNLIHIQSNIASDYTLKIINVTGKLCFSNSFYESADIDLQNISSGVYIISISNINHSLNINQKFIKL